MKLLRQALPTGPRSYNYREIVSFIRPPLPRALAIAQLSLILVIGHYNMYYDRDGYH